MLPTSPMKMTNGRPGEIRMIPLTFDSSDSEASALELVTTLRPEWKSADSKIEFVRFTEGITNTLMKAENRKDGLSQEEIDNEAVLLRAYGRGTHVLIDRQRETQNHELLMQYGLAPALLARFQNGMMYRFLRGRVSKPEDLRKPSIYRAVARRLAQWHATMPCLPSKPTKTNGVNGPVDGPIASAVDLVAPGKPAPNVWTVMQKWLLALPRETKADRDRRARLEVELTKLIDELSHRDGLGKNNLVFAHCDLLHGNVIIAPGEVTDGENSAIVNFIDYEYATPSPAAFDLANHFAEWGGFECDYSVLPTRSQRLEFIREYIHAYFSLTPDRPADMVEEVEVQKLFKEVDIYRGVPGFYWGIWAIVQSHISQIDFDYASYAEVRLGEYWAWREETNGARKLEGKEMPLRERRWAQD